MSLTQRKLEPPSPANETWEDLERCLTYPACHQWSKAALFEYDHKSCIEQAVLTDAVEGDRRGKSFRMADRSANITASWFSVFYFVSIASKILQKYPNHEFD
jgi:hypothetical protein